MTTARSWIKTHLVCIHHELLVSDDVCYTVKGAFYPWGYSKVRVTAYGFAWDL